MGMVSQKIIAVKMVRDNIVTEPEEVIDIDRSRFRDISPFRRLLFQLVGFRVDGKTETTVCGHTDEFVPESQYFAITEAI
jgi:hypothetical protein